MSAAISPSPLDSRRFGLRAFRARVQDAQVAEEVAGLVDADLVIARVPVERLDLVQRLEAAGGRLCGTLIFYDGATPSLPAPDVPPGEVLRPFAAEDAEPLAALARTSFADLRGHYHVDPRLDPHQATEGYVEWALQGARGDGGSGWALVTISEGRLSGFLTARRAAPDLGEVVLNAVAPTQQRRGIYGRLFQAACRRFAAEGASRVEVSTQLANWTPQKVWLRCGLRPREAWHTLHLWPSRRPPEGAA